MEKYFNYIYECLKTNKYDNNTHVVIYTSYIKATGFYEILTEQDKHFTTKLFENYLNKCEEHDLDHEKVLETADCLYINMVYYNIVACYEML